MNDNIRGGDVPKRGGVRIASEAACKILTLNLQEVEILRRHLPDFDLAMCKILSRRETPLQDFVPGRKPPKLQGDLHLQDFVPLPEILLLNFCATLVEFLNNTGSVTSQLGL